jgi:hypothetical protein
MALLFSCAAILLWIAARVLRRAFADGGLGELFAGVFCGLGGLWLLFVGALRMAA